MAKKIQNNYDQKKFDEKVQLMPWYIQKYIDVYEEDRSVASLLGYLFDFDIFLQWLLSEGLAEGPTIKDIPLSALNDLTVDNISGYRKFLRRKKKNSDATIGRKLSSLKSLFNYLHIEAEDEHRTPLLERNIFSKIKIKSTRKTLETRAAALVGKVLSDEINQDQFRDFVGDGFGRLPGLSKRQLTHYKKNKERDKAIVSLVLGSGLRVSEVASLTIDDLSMKNNAVIVIRKGKSDPEAVRFTNLAKIDLESYLTIRKDRYNAADAQKALFLTQHLDNFATPMSKNAIQKMVDRYAEAFGMPKLSVHKLRHSFASLYQSKNNNIPKLQRQLGHKSSETTNLYVITSDKEMMDALMKLDGDKSTN